LNPKKLSDTLGGTVTEIEDAIEFLLKPDPKSRHKEHDGRRLIREGQFQYFVPSWETYQKIRNADERREYNRMKQAEYRDKKSKAQIRREKKASDDYMAKERRFDRAVKSGDEKLADDISSEGLPDGLREQPIPYVAAEI
jgi:hypothetical protein